MDTVFLKAKSASLKLTLPKPDFHAGSSPSLVGWRGIQVSVSKGYEG